VALFDSSDYLSVAEVNGDAARRLQVKTGDPVEVFLENASHNP
jgi:S-adenosylmethionine hydrolase